MFSLATTMFYMLSAYIAFLIGSSEKLSIYLLFLVPVGFVSGYLLDRLNSVKSIWQDDQSRLIVVVANKYLLFLLVSGLFFAAGKLFAQL